MKIFQLLLVLFVTLKTFPQQNVTNDKKLISGKSDCVKFYIFSKFNVTKNTSDVNIRM